MCNGNGGDRLCDRKTACAGATVAGGEGVICSDAPDEEAEAALKALGGAPAKLLYELTAILNRLEQQAIKKAGYIVIPRRTIHILKA